ncbi:dipeptidase PepE [Polaribacter staleyi]|uniref:dipeptidase PepE n=1 Tax=Polaribacter staleyi TaxID=2022337 RepID=UPI0031BA922D
MKKMIIASTSTVHGSKYLAYLLPTLKKHFTGVKELLFIPYARPSGISYDEYTAIAKKAFSEINIDVKGIHEFENAKEAVNNASAIFTGGGNTFELVNQLYKNDVLTTLKEVIENGTPYLGTSAGSNICGVNMKNTNDMPIVYPPSFTTLGCINFNINAHYLDPIDGSTHMGETRETRIKEFHVFNETPVLGLREGSWLEVDNDAVFLRGKLTARLFKRNEQPIELISGDLLKF